MPGICLLILHFLMFEQLTKNQTVVFCMENNLLLFHLTNLILQNEINLLAMHGIIYFKAIYILPIFIFKIYWNGSLLPLCIALVVAALLAHRTKKTYFVKKFRYAPATQLWRGRLHVMGGGKEDRHEPGLEHWSLAVKDGKALENEWRAEVPIPRGGPHRYVGVYLCHLHVVAMR
jgi:hypothetical protein